MASGGRRGEQKGDGQGWGESHMGWAVQAAMSTRCSLRHRKEHDGRSRPAAEAANMTKLPINVCVGEGWQTERSYGLGKE